MSATTKPSAIILGATGATGKLLLGELLSASHYAQVHAFVRKPFKATSSFKDNEKLVEHTLDFDKLVDAGDGVEALCNVKAEAVYITLGTTRAKAGSAQAFERIDREYVLAAAKAALQTNAQSIGQRVVYCSSVGSTSSSRLLYSRSKGLTEEGLASLGYPDCIVFRPAFLTSAKRPETRVLESAAQFFVSNVVSRFTDSSDIPVSELAKAICKAGIVGSSGLTSAGVGSPPSDKFHRKDGASGAVTIVGNAEAKRLAKQTSG